MTSKDLKIKLGDKWPIFEEMHRFILSLNPKIKFYVPTIYVVYCLEDKPIAVAYFKGKFVSECQIDIGFALKERPKIPNFTDAQYMQHSGINYSIQLNSRNNITKKITKIIKSTIVI